MSQNTNTGKAAYRAVEQVSIRVPANSYVKAVFVGSFFSALALYLEYPIVSYVLFAAAWFVTPTLAFTDRLVFNGKRVSRTGPLPRLWAYLTGTRFWLKLRDIEQVETLITPTLKRSNRVYLRFRTTIVGQGIEFRATSGGRDYRRFTTALFSVLSEETLDSGSIELRDHLADPAASRRLARQSDIPEPDVLEHAFRASGTASRGRNLTKGDPALDGASAEKAGNLRRLGNQLMLSGSMLQAMESFRRAVSLKPEDPWLLFDFARCIYAFAGTENNVGLERKAVAMMRLAEMRAGSDGRLLSRLGESYFQIGDWKRSQKAFRKAMEAIGDHFRSLRGMAEVALRDGKLAHVVHNFNAASRFANTPGLRRWTLAEADYFSRLSNDDEYLEMELGRVNLLSTLDRWKRTTLRLCMIGLPVIALGLYFGDEATANTGWGLSGGMLVMWVILSLGSRMFASRIAPELLAED